jgi:hypothetical protein
MVTGLARSTRAGRAAPPVRWDVRWRGRDVHIGWAGELPRAHARTHASIDRSAIAQPARARSKKRRRRHALAAPAHL